MSLGPTDTTDRFCASATGCGWREGAANRQGVVWWPSPTAYVSEGFRSVFYRGGVWWPSPTAYFSEGFRSVFYGGGGGLGAKSSEESGCQLTITVHLSRGHHTDPKPLSSDQLPQTVVATAVATEMGM